MVYRSVFRLLLISDSSTYTPSDDEIYKYMRRVFKHISPISRVDIFLAKKKIISVRYGVTLVDLCIPSARLQRYYLYALSSFVSASLTRSFGQVVLKTGPTQIE
jgi:hypothetical protein